MKKDYSQLAKNIVENVGGTKNVQDLNHCMTRLRFVIKDESKVEVEKLKRLEGVVNVIVSGGQYQVVIGTNVEDVYKAIGENTNLILNHQKSEAGNEINKKKKNVVAAFMEIVSSLFLPVLTALSAAGILKGILIALTTLKWLSPESGTYTILYSAADAFFYFLPVILAFTAATKFGADKFVSVSIAGAMIYPSLIAIFGAGKTLDFIGIPVKLISYTSSVIPIIVTVYILSKLEKALKKLIPSIVQGIFVPLLSLVIMVPSALIIIGPITSEIGNGIAAGYTFIYNLSPAIAGGVLAILWPIMIVFGVHWGLVPVVFNNIGTYGYDTLLPVTVATNFAMAGAVLGVFLKTKNKKLKELSMSSCISALIGGITEPAIYGVNMKYKKPFYIACTISGIGGIITGIFGAQWPGLMTVCALTLPTLVLMKGGIGVLIASALGFFGTAICTYLFGFNDSMIEKSDWSETTETTNTDKTTGTIEVKASLDGKVIPITEVEDEVFSTLALGEGVAIIPETNLVLSPVDGVISAVLEKSGHAVGITLDNGAELLIHVGIDTVKMNGAGFTTYVKIGDKVKMGDKLIKFDSEMIKENGFKTTTMMTITNSTEYPNIEFIYGMDAKAGKDTVIKF